MSRAGGRIVSRLVILIVLGALAVAAIFAALHRQEISDHFAAQRFTPSVAISEIIDRLSLTSVGERIFLASQPTLDASQRFSNACANVDHTEEGHVLGCYSDGRIALFDVTDDRLDGIVEVTAAHELLHAVFARFGDSERAEITEQLEQAFDSLRTSHPELAQRMEVYASLSSGAFANELHSVLGTEVRELPAQLEEHYAIWFADRERIVDSFDSYHGVFVELRERAAGLQAELEGLRTSIERRSEQYDVDVAAFNAEWSQFLARNDAFEFSDNPEEFYLLRDSFDARRNALNSELAALNAEIERYENMRVELQHIGELNSELQEKLNSELAPPASTPVP